MLGKCIKIDKYDRYNNYMYSSIYTCFRFKNKKTYYYKCKPRHMRSPIHVGMKKVTETIRQD